jgi:hypothetical protein
MTKFENSLGINTGEGLARIQTPGNYSEENIQHTEHGESLKSIKLQVFNS